MKIYIIKSKKRNWTNEAGREALGINVGQRVKLTSGDRQVEVCVNRAPAAAGRVMRAVTAMTGLYGVAVDQYSLQALGVKPGDTVQATSANVVSVQRAAAVAPRSTSSGKPATLKDRLSGLKVGETIELSEAAVKSGAYSKAKELGIQLKKTSPTTMVRSS